jgi:uncharacterized membrane protein YagU involved in acid resistance
MNPGGWLLWGLGATLLLTLVLTGAQAMGLTRMSLPFLLGSVVTAGHDRARIVGTFLHFAVGLVFALGYVAVFDSLGNAGIWRGAVLGFVHGASALTIGMSLLPSMHRGMATEQHGPSASRLLEPPGMLALHYGVATPIVVMVSHVIYGAVLGAFYHPG